MFLWWWRGWWQKGAGFVEICNIYPTQGSSPFAILFDRVHKVLWTQHTCNLHITVNRSYSVILRGEYRPLYGTKMYRIHSNSSTLSVSKICSWSIMIVSKSDLKSIHFYTKIIDFTYFYMPRAWWRGVSVYKGMSVYLNDYDTYAWEAFLGIFLHTNIRYGLQNILNVAFTLCVESHQGVTWTFACLHHILPYLHICQMHKKQYSLSNFIMVVKKYIKCLILPKFQLQLQKWYHCLHSKPASGNLASWESAYLIALQYST